MISGDADLSGVTIFDFVEEQDRREREAREARTCKGCRVEIGSKRDNDDGRRVWHFFACDDAELMPCPTCRPAEAADWYEERGEPWYVVDQCRSRARRVDG